MLLFEYLRSADTLLGVDNDRPLFTTTIRKTKELTLRRMKENDIGRMVTLQSRTRFDEDQSIDLVLADDELNDSLHTIANDLLESTLR